MKSMKQITILIFLVCNLNASSQVTLISRDYQYDNLNRLTTITHENGNTEQYFYDQIGNRTQKITTISCELPTAFLSGTTTIEEGEAATLNISFSGDTPYTYTLNNEEYNLSSSSISYPVTPVTSTNYSISEISNACGQGIPSGAATVTVIPAVLLPDFEIQSVTVTKYSSDYIEYDVTVKNIGNLSVSLSNFSLATFGSSDYIKDNTDSFKGTYDVNSGTLAPDASITYQLTDSINWSGNEHIFIIMADYYEITEEKSDVNNGYTALIKKCSDNNEGDLEVGGILGENFYAAKGSLKLLTGTVAKENSVFVAPNIEGLPTSFLGQNNITVITGTCLNGIGE